MLLRICVFNVVFSHHLLRPYCSLCCVNQHMKSEAMEGSRVSIHCKMEVYPAFRNLQALQQLIAILSRSLLFRARTLARFHVHHLGSAAKNRSFCVLKEDAGFLASTVAKAFLWESMGSPDQLATCVKARANPKRVPSRVPQRLPERNLWGLRA